MLVGTADIETLAASAPEILRFESEPVELGGVRIFQLTAELPYTARECLLPPALHPTIPPALSLQVWEVDESRWGPFRLASLRLSCRSGVRARGFTRAVRVTTESAQAGLAGCFGYPAEIGEIDFRRGYDGVSAEVRGERGSLLVLEAIDPEPLGDNDVQYTGTLNLARTPLGLRLVQVETSVKASRVERLKPRIDRFESEAWGDRRIVPKRLIAASVANADITLAPVRFVCRPDELAFTGTEAVA